MLTELLPSDISCADVPGDVWMLICGNTPVKCVSTCAFSVCVTAAGFQNMALSPMLGEPSPAKAMPSPTADCSRTPKAPAYDSDGAATPIASAIPAANAVRRDRQ